MEYIVSRLDIGDVLGIRMILLTAYWIVIEHCIAQPGRNRSYAPHRNVAKNAPGAGCEDAWFATNLQGRTWTSVSFMGMLLYLLTTKTLPPQFLPWFWAIGLAGPMGLALSPLIKIYEVNHFHSLRGLSRNDFKTKRANSFTFKCGVSRINVGWGGWIITVYHSFTIIAHSLQELCIVERSYPSCP